MTHPSNGKTVGKSASARLLVDRRTALAALLLLGAFVGLLYFEGRPAWCEGGLALWSPAWNSCTSQNLFDPYSLSHVLHGVIFFWLLRPLAGRVPLAWRLIAAMGLEVGWEVLENSPWIIARYRQDTAAFDYTGDSILNSLGDLASTIAGFAFASRFGWKTSVALFVVFELWMLWLAHDNLSLNILMLLWPIEAIKSWQLSAVSASG
jgi:Protein of unknown function (DUF2585)